MSHVVSLAIKIKNLPALEAAAKALGCELDMNANTHLYYAGNRAKCDHAIRVTGVAGAYEIGVVRGKDGTYELQADFYQGGRGLEAAVGRNATKLHDEYAAQVAMQHLQRAGRRLTRTVQADGTIVIVGR